jgi:hypothetical protein
MWQWKWWTRGEEEKTKQRCDETPKKKMTSFLLSSHEESRRASGFLSLP